MAAAGFVDGGAEPATATIGMDTESYLLLATGRRTPADLAERVEVAGNADLAGRVLAGLNVMN